MTDAFYNDRRNTASPRKERTECAGGSYLLCKVTKGENVQEGVIYCVK